MTLVIDGETIETTPKHPFYEMVQVPGKVDGELIGIWTGAGDLVEGDSIYTANGGVGTVVSVEVETRPQIMYDFTIGTAHTYFVGEGEWLVHNCLTTLGGRKITGHAEDQVNNRNFSLEKIDDVIDNFTNKYEQADGAFAYVKKSGRNKYDIVIEGEDGVVTVMKNKSRHELRNLADNHGWE